ncbi:MAG TPA: mycofactocin-coupled SDR family oxidoreductase [Nocardioides sp.]|uniref:mycofactocin-coupled SDR family oxidoreductase n=1 Tax=uncultured Nocardioides sp. TaxID=198441 RepID=UPI000EB8AFAA|nr:mycofactocin-coupled SDR family oxidoreductase [uncultured Nocardioides sp.]HCB05109.1 SDR family mycofactocin-dependent oxidoreductase [Nocardioides sp.]HRI94142.1 mycofactocin-coupled SDR family oxidoreductase [Nocardioides sp.]HRK44194.1 mycofactocin-coupled SDR family oxidoreductase [Nocardioides sp.]
MNRLQGKVALVTGAARGQGRSHAVRLAEEGADIIALDLCDQIESIPYPMGTWEDLKETASLVEATGRRIVFDKVDVRSTTELAEFVPGAAAELGRLDVIVANAGVWSHAPFLEMSDETYLDVIDVNQHGVFRTCRVAAAIMVAQGTGGSIILTSSTAGRKGFSFHAHYASSKHAVVGLMRVLANELGQHSIRVNTIHPTSVFTPMAQNDEVYRLFVPDADSQPTQEEFAAMSASTSLLPVPWVQPEDISNAVVFLASDEGRFITGSCLPVDAGFHERN